jgi:hypothetical protein
MIFNSNDFEIMKDEYELNKLATEVEMAIIINEKFMNDYDATTSYIKMTELLNLIGKLQDLKNKAVIHNAKKVLDMCEVYIVDAEYQMNKLRDKYM